MEKIVIATQHKDEVVPITEKIQSYIKKHELTEGVCVVFVTHTTCAITTADLDPGTDLDLLEAYREMIPKIKFRHPHNPIHAPDHLLSSLIGPSLVLPFKNNQLILGTWQEVVLLEFDGPRDREVYLFMIEDASY